MHEVGYPVTSPCDVMYMPTSSVFPWTFLYKIRFKWLTFTFSIGFRIFPLFPFFFLDRGFVSRSIRGNGLIRGIIIIIRYFGHVGVNNFSLNTRLTGPSAIILLKHQLFISQFANSNTCSLKPSFACETANELFQILGWINLRKSYKISINL